MRILFLASYPPRKCGIATFTNNLKKGFLQSLTDDEDLSVGVVAVSPENGDCQYPDEVVKSFRRGDYKAYREAAEYINENSDLCILQHEYGIFGGYNGVFVLSLIYNLKVPVITTFHTILNNPDDSQRKIIEAISRKSARVVVMNRLAMDFLEHIYKVPDEKIQCIEHGVPLFEKPDRNEVRKKLGFDGHKVILTFGLLSRNKGLELVINALPKIVSHYPDVKYIILGKTHPEVIRQSGEEYRNYLKLLAAKKGVGGNVIFDNRFLSDQELLEHIYASDFYITPYRNEEQISSGTLAYAVGVGALTLSTPYWHAREILDDGRGVLFPFGDYTALADKVIDLIKTPREAESIRASAALYGEDLGWDKIAEKYHILAKKVSGEVTETQAELTHSVDISVLPDFNMTHLLKMTDSTGLIQHSRYDVPDFNHGYCLDDNARGLMLIAKAHRFVKDERLTGLISVYLGFINYMRKDDGGFHNYLNYDRTYNASKDSEDSVGRLIWALGCFICYVDDNRYNDVAYELFTDAVSQTGKLKSIRGKANAIIGISYMLKHDSSDIKLKEKLVQLADSLVETLPAQNNSKWFWFENILTYDNALMPLSLLYAYRTTGNEKYYKAARGALAFLENHVFMNHVFSPIGNKKWYKKDEAKSLYDQQPVEAMTMTDMYLQMYEITQDAKYLKKMNEVYLWYLGENILHKPLYDHETGACFDGLSGNGINANKGAESTLAYWYSHFTVIEAYFKEFGL